MPLNTLSCPFIKQELSIVLGAAGKTIGRPYQCHRCSSHTHAAMQKQDDRVSFIVDRKYVSGP